MTPRELIETLGVGTGREQRKRSVTVVSSASQGKQRRRCPARRGHPPLQKIVCCGQDIIEAAEGNVKEWEIPMKAV
jgi:hypothetical protein